MARYIDADALIEFVEGRYTVTWNHDYDGGIKDACIDILNFIDNAPTIDAVPRWIPCEERLPEKEKPYHRRDFYLTTNAYGAVNVTTYEFENDFQKRGWQSDIRIIAWMPLPEPYGGERKDDE